MRFFLLLSLFCFLSYGYDYNPDLRIPNYVEILEEGTLSSKVLFRETSIIMIANRDAYEVVKKAKNFIALPHPLILVPNVSGAPKWVRNAFIKPSLIKDAKKNLGKILYDENGELKERLNFLQDDNDYFEVFVVDNEGIAKIFSKNINESIYDDEENQRKMFQTILKILK